MTASWQIPGTAWWWMSWACNPPQPAHRWLAAFTYQHAIARSHHP